jgi:hypothetical protein
MKVNFEVIGKLNPTGPSKYRTLLLGTARGELMGAKLVSGTACSITGVFLCVEASVGDQLAVGSVLAVEVG